MLASLSDSPATLTLFLWSFSFYRGMALACAASTGVRLRMKTSKWSSLPQVSCPWWVMGTLTLDNTDVPSVWNYFLHWSSLWWLTSCLYRQMRRASQIVLFLSEIYIYTLSGQWAIENIWKSGSSWSHDSQYNRMTIGTHPQCSVLVCSCHWGDLIFFPISAGEQRSRNKWLSVFYHVYQMWLARWKARGIWWVRNWASILYHKCIVGVNIESFVFFTLLLYSFRQSGRWLTGHEEDRGK